MPRPALADSFNPNANDQCLFNRGAGGRQDFSGRRFHAASADRRAITSPGSMPPPAWLIRSTRTRTMLSIRSRCRRTARFWRAAISRASADRRAIASPGSMPPPAWLIRSTRTRTTDVVCNRGAGGRQDFGGRRFHRASADRRATASPGSMPRPAWLTRSTRTRTMMSIQSRCRRTARF